ncbi:MAG: hypothetical protein AAGK66_04140 [Pseudomonadota bacterium]
MDDTRSTTTRPLALAAMLMVAGVLFLRALALFSEPPQTETIGSPQEQRFTALIEPFVGPDRVRTSIQRNADGHYDWLVLIDSQAVSEGAASEHAPMIANLAVARGFQADRDSLEIIQQPFAGTLRGALTPLEIAELAALGIALISLIILYVRGPEQKRMEQQALPTPQPGIKEDADLQPLNDNSRRKAAALANAAPERSANLIRRWMQEDNQ